MGSTQRIVHEGPRGVSLRRATEVLVCGGGLGGVAAALGAARAGARTVLLERQAFLGGVATAGQCCSMLNCFATADGQIVTAGIPLEIADALAAATGYGSKWRAHRGHLIYDLEAAKRVLEELVLGAGAEVLYHNVVAAPILDGPRLEGVMAESPSGRGAVLARTVVDATGDADVAALTGAPVRSVGQRGLHSLCFRLGHVDVDRFVAFFERHPEQYAEHMDVDWTLADALAQYRDCGTFLFPHGGGMQLALLQQARADGELPEKLGLYHTLDACQMHALRDRGVVHVITGFVNFDGLDDGLLSGSLTDGRRLAALIADVFRRRLPGFDRCFLLSTADALGVRVSRHVQGHFELTSQMIAESRHFPDVVARVMVPDQKIKHPGRHAWGVQVPRAAGADVPYGCLLPSGVDGLLMGAGRSLSVDNPWLLRVMVHTMAVGQAAGVAAALAARQRTTPRALDPAPVQAELRRQGVTLE